MWITCEQPSYEIVVCDRADICHLGDAPRLADHFRAPLASMGFQGHANTKGGVVITRIVHG